MVSHVFYSDDNGTTWKIGGSVTRPKTTESTIVELSDGRLLLGSRNQVESENQRVMSISADGGLTFPTTWLETQLIEPRGVQASLFYYGLNSKTGKGNILFSNPNHAEIRSNGTLKLSTDNGKTWSESVVYAPKKSPYFTGYSDIVKLANGDIGVLYERGNYDEKAKGERYEEIGFSVISKDAFPSLRSPGAPIPAPQPTALPPAVLGKCVIDGGQGKTLFKDTVTLEKCQKKCDEFKETNKNRTCEFDGKVFKK
jgi:Neuraminidase (sialidase)